MSEYQYYEFHAIDRPLGEAEQKALRAMSSRARITAASFTNHYEWGDLKGDPKKLVARYFDLHLYLANWGTRRLMIRLPKRLLDVSRFTSILHDVEWAEVSDSAGNLIVDVSREEIDDWDEDGSGWLAALAPLRSDLLSGDLRLLYLVWLGSVEDGTVDDSAMEPLPGIGPLTAALEAFAEFFAIDADLVTAAAERTDGAGAAGTSRDAIVALPEREKTELLLRLVDGDPHVAAELKNRIRTLCPQPSVDLRSARDLRARAAAIREERERLVAAKREAERRKKEKEAEKVRRARLEAVKRRGMAVWDTVEAEILRRNPAGYQTAMGLLLDLEAIAAEQGTLADFSRRIEGIRERHARKGQFIELMKGLAGR
jgi:hypothetical protein